MGGNFNSWRYIVDSRQNRICRISYSNHPYEDDAQIRQAPFHLLDITALKFPKRSIITQITGYGKA